MERTNAHGIKDSSEVISERGSEDNHTDEQRGEEDEGEEEEESSEDADVRRAKSSSGRSFLGESTGWLAEKLSRPPLSSAGGRIQRKKTVPYDWPSLIGPSIGADDDAIDKSGLVLYATCMNEPCTNGARYCSRSILVRDPHTHDKTP